MKKLTQVKGEWKPEQYLNAKQNFIYERQFSWLEGDKHKNYARCIKEFEQANPAPKN